MNILNRKTAYYILETRIGVSTYSKGEILQAIIWILDNDSILEFNNAVTKYNLADFGFTILPSNAKLVA